MRVYPTFGAAVEGVGKQLRDQSYEVKTLRWQSSDISDKPGATMREVLNISFKVPMHYEDLGSYRRDIEPNLPWADDHFEERVSGVPWNPGEQWRNWPWALSADNHRKEEGGPLLGGEDWAYLAGFLDGEGTIQIRDNDSHVRLILYQKNPKTLERLQEKFKVGTVKTRERGQEQELNGKRYENPMSRWLIGAYTEALWILSNCLPYLIEKRELGEKALQVMRDNPPKERGRPRREIWGKEWEPRFSHTYMQRYWPQFDNGTRPTGLMYRYGDLRDVVNHLAKDPLTRQAFLPVWFPEDTGVVHGERVPCTLGYHFILRNGFFHHTYYIRSCDFYRHFRDDLYLSARLHLWVLDQLRKGHADREGMDWNMVKPGFFTFHCVSMHCFIADWQRLFGKAR